MKQNKTKKNTILQNYRQTGTAFGANSSEAIAMLKIFKDPFNQHSGDIRICDAYAFPTATYHLRGTINTYMPVNKTVGTIVLSAHPFMSSIDISNNSFVGSTIIQSTAMSAYSSNTAIYGATTPFLMNSKLTSYRTVAVGFKIRVQQPELVRTGRLIVAPVPFTDALPGFNLMNFAVCDTGTAAASRLCGGLSVIAANTTAILGLPGAFEISMADLGLKDLILHPKPNSSQYQTFHTSDNKTTYNSTRSYSTNNAVTATTNLVYPGDIDDLLNPAGMTGFIVRFEGCPTDSPLVDIEYIYHLEGTPLIGTPDQNGVQTPVPSGQLSTSVNTSAFQHVLDIVSRMPWGEMVSSGLGANGIVGMGINMLSRVRG